MINGFLVRLLNMSAYCEYIADSLSAWRDVNVRKMFGGYGLYAQHVMFGLVDDDVLYFKVDNTNIEDYKKLHSQPFTYEARGKVIALSYWKVLEEIIEDSSEFAIWAEKSFQIALINKKRSFLKKVAKLNKSLTYLCYNVEIENKATFYE